MTTGTYPELEPNIGNWATGHEKLGFSGLNPAADYIIERVDLECVGGGSNKVYILIMSQDSDGIHVEAFYGRRHAYLSKTILYKGLSESDALAALNNQYAAKYKKGYKVAGSMTQKPQHISNAKKYDYRIVWPMGAQPLKEGKKKQEILESNDWIAEEKIDGVRLTVHITPTGLRYFSRSGGKNSPDSPLEKTHAFAHTAHIVFPEKYIGTIIDVEAFADGMKHEEISGHINATDGRDNSFIYLKAFDLIQEGPVDLVNLEWKFRRAKLTQLLHELAQVFGPAKINKKANYPVVDETHILSNGLFRLSRYTINDKVAFHDEIVLAGGEGTMWKNINAKYKEGAKPVNTWYKWKKEDTADVVIVGFTDGKGKYDGQIGAVRYAEYLTEEEIQELGIKKKHTNHMFKDGKDYYLVEIGQCSGMTDAQRQDFTDNQMSYLGQVMEVEYMERTKKGSLLHPRFLQVRDDKSEKDCIYHNQCQGV